jgi:hypothetical protein
LLIGGAAALVILGVLVAPVVILTGRSNQGACSLALRYQGRGYLARPVVSAQVVEGVAIGVGVTSGCGTQPANIGIRTLVGVRPSIAVGLAADQSSLYVRRGVCPQTPPSRLLRCLKRA